MRALMLEFAKLKGRRVWLVCLGCAVILVAWLAAQAMQGGAGARDGTANLLYGAPIINSMVLTLAAAIIASRVCDVDHEARGLKSLLCMQRPTSLFFAKLACSCIVLLLPVAIEATGIGLLSAWMGFADAAGPMRLAAFAASQYAAMLFTVVLVQAIALRWENQFVSLAVGLTLSLLGLFGLFLPMAFERVVPSCYFALLSTVMMSWDATTRTITYSQLPFPWGDLALLAVLVVAITTVSAVWFSRREA